ncbi:reticulon-4b isoform X2 [Tachysurus fulvidraco]|uniref:reticulon-4b isoform X2 n=1 Tax=Tachysurus fulvidraco TaxID=1234273 RepID=UPI000F4FF3EA|nr:reticulon-4b isoform X2 [Tachysurus fulvidraco]
MADTEQVSSTTPNEVEEDKMKPWTESAWSATTDKELFQDEGLFGVKQDVQNVREAPVEAAGEVSRQEETEKENKECLEKSVGLVSNPVECESPEEPDSTQMEDTGDQEPVVSSAAELHNAFRSEELQELRTKPQEELFFESDHETQEEDFGFNSSVKVEAFSAPVEPEKAVSSVVEEKKEPERRTLLEESFGADSESTPASPASPSAHEPSLPSSAAASFQNLMQYTSVMELLYWRDLKNSGIVFGASLLLLLSLSVCSIISVLSYVALAFLSVTISFRIYKGVLQAIQKSDEGHPFKLYLEQEVSLPDDVVRKYSDVALGRVNTAINELRRLFLVEDLVDSLKFAVLMWILTYVGALFNGLTLLILGLVAMFTCPVVYEKHQAQIDHYVALVRNHVKDVVGKVQAKIPGAKKKEE